MEITLHWEILGMYVIYVYDIFFLLIGSELVFLRLLGRPCVENPP